MALQCLSSSPSCSALSQRLRCLSISCSSGGASLRSQPYKSLAFSTNVAGITLSNVAVSMRAVEKGSPRRDRLVVCEAAPKKADSAAKRARQAEKRRMYNKSKKSEMRTRMKKVFVALTALRKRREAQAEELLPIEKLVAEAYSAIDKAVKAGTLHRNTGARRKSRLARRKKSVEIHHGWYTPAPAV